MTKFDQAFSFSSTSTDYFLMRYIQCSSDMSEPKYTRNARQPNTGIRVCIYAHTRMHIGTYAYTAYMRMPHWHV